MGVCVGGVRWIGLDLLYNVVDNCNGYGQAYIDSVTVSLFAFLTFKAAGLLPMAVQPSLLK